MDKKEVLLYLVLPAYNEEEVLEQNIKILLDYYDTLTADKEIDERSRILIVDDGSKDRTWELISEGHKSDYRVEGIKLSRNEGMQTALYAGMEKALEQGAEAVITIDADLQQDIYAIPRFLQQYREGSDIVIGVRSSRDTDGFMKKTTASMYYKIMNWMGCEITPNHADYRLLSNRALDSLMQYGERNLFLRGIIPTLGYQHSTVEFEVKERTAGESKFTMKKMVTLAMDGITSFTIRPIHLVFIMGFVILCISGLMMIHILWDYFHGNTVSGWSSILVSIWLLGGIGIFSIGLVGEYVGRAYIETKKRPRYFIDEFLTGGKQDADKMD
ncbi:MAG: glycosyltransferase family 2 protein [Clostridiales bacterium]|nr:glycosyltransferase family 2 protein [Clostridiales bacterium]